MRTLAVLLALASSAAAQESAGTDFFESRIRPVLVERCLKCHGEKKPKGGLRLDSRAGWEKGGDAGPAIVPKKAGASLLLRQIRAEAGTLPQMPPDKPLPASVVADFVQWIDMGAPDPRAGTAAVAKQIDWKSASEFWAFRPVAAGDDRSIDRHIDDKLAERGLKASEPADPWTLIRRVTYDLTGLPPTETEVRAFLSDPSPDAFAKVVDRLLASPAYGEQQARRWLDLARYAEDQAHVTEGKLGHGWRYRDWVVEAFNKDLPYDRFVKLQIAADLMERPEDDPADRRALGFIGLGNIYARPNDLARARAEQWDDRIDTLTRTFLGLTVSCARCHDHKFDPIPTLDYYSLAGVIASTKDTVIPVAPREETAAYEAALTISTEVGGKAAAFLQAETDRRALEKVETLVDAALAVWADPTVNKALAEFLKKEKTPKTREDAEKLQKSVRDNLARPLKQRNLDPLKGLFGEKGAYPLTEQIVVDAASPEWRKEYEPLKAAAKEAAANVPPEPAKCHGVADVEKPADLKVYIRGNPNKTGEAAPRRFLRVLAGPESARFTRGSGRLELAAAIADPANPLGARVMVNRIWQQHFGRGIVATPSNFGALGSRPTHPELLDALADRFVRGNWSVKRLHREILLSAAYRRSSTADARNLTLDPENQWLWRADRRRLTVEELRDSILVVSGGLDPTPGGPSADLDDSKNLRRTLYAKISRMELHPLLRLFDFPDPNLTSEKRTETTQPQQSLFLLNNPFMIARAKALAARMASETTPAAAVRRAYALAFVREPSEDERAAGVAFLSAEDAGEGRTKNALTRAERFAQALLASNSFLFID
jgi:cytochrome c553